MLKIGLEALKAIERGTLPGVRVKVYFQQPETYTKDDYLDSIGAIKTSMSAAGYEIANASVTLKNKDRYFSKRFGRELPIGRTVEISYEIAGQEIIIFRGTVSNSWKSNRTTVSLDLNASLLETLNLRRTDVYRAPGEIVPLGVVFGDFSNSSVPCTPIDADGRVQHINDFPMERITRVLDEAGTPVASGFKPFTSYQDETGRSIACLIFDQPQKGRKFFVSGKGTIDTSTGNLIENPADFIRHVMLNIQGKDATTIDAAALAEFYADCLKNEVNISCFLNEATTLKAIFDELGTNIHAHWLLSDARSVMKLRSRSSNDSPVRYRFKEEEIIGPEHTSVELVNEATINFGYDWGGQKYQASITKHVPLSKKVYGKAAKTLDLRMIQSSRQAEEIVDAYLATYAMPQLQTAFKHNLRSIYLEPGDSATLSEKSGIGEDGYVDAGGEIISKEISGIDISYVVAMARTGDPYPSELITLTKASGAARIGTEVSYRDGVITLSVYDENRAPLAGTAVTVNGTKKMTDAAGKVSFSAPHGTFRAVISSSQYGDDEVIFTV